MHPKPSKPSKASEAIDWTSTRLPAATRDKLASIARQWKHAYQSGRSRKPPRFANNGEVPLWAVIDRLIDEHEDHARRSRKSSAKRRTTNRTDN